MLEMSDAKDNEEAGQNVPLAVEETQQLVEAQVEETSNRVEIGKAEASAEDKNAEPEDNSECIPQHDVQNSENTLHSVPVTDNAHVLNKSECEYASDMKSEAEEVPQCDKGIKNDANVCQSNADTAETTVEAKPEACEVADSKTCNNGVSNSIPSSHKEPNTQQAVPPGLKAEIKGGLVNENRDNENQVAVAPADNGSSISKNLYFLDPDHSYDGHESGTMRSSQLL